MNAGSPTPIERWTKPASPEDQPEPGYDAWLAAEIEAGVAELDAGKSVTLEEVKKEFGLE